MAKQKITQAQQINTLITQANSGTAGGTMYYINLGGIKMMWLMGANCVTASTATVIFPTSFFTTIITAVAGFQQMSGTAAVYSPEIRSLTGTGCTFALTAAAGSGTEPMMLSVVGI